MSVFLSLLQFNTNVYHNCILQQKDRLIMSLSAIRFGQQPINYYDTLRQTERLGTHLSKIKGITPTIDSIGITPVVESADELPKELLISARRIVACKPVSEALAIFSIPPYGPIEVRKMTDNLTKKSAVELLASITQDLMGGKMTPRGLRIKA
jgi:hypothetical protein